jgi:hypothetical protein
MTILFQVGCQGEMISSSVYTKLAPSEYGFCQTPTHSVSSATLLLSITALFREPKAREDLQLDQTPTVWYPPTVFYRLHGSSRDYA